MSQMEEYSDIHPEWEVQTFTNKDGPFPAVEVDWEINILVGKLHNADQLLSDLQDEILRQEQRLVRHTEASSDGATMLDDTHLTSRFENWNLYYLDHPAAEILWDYVTKGFHKYLDIHDIRYPHWHSLSIQSWGNILRKGESIGEHEHISEQSLTAFSTNFCVTADESTSTVYNPPGYTGRGIHIPNEPGQLVVFPAWLPHETTKFESENSQRITIASDISIEDWHNASYENGERTSHWLPFDEPPSRKLHSHSHSQWEDIPGVDETIATLVNYKGELTRELLEDMKENGSNFCKKNIVPNKYDPSGQPDEYPGNGT